MSNVQTKISELAATSNLSANDLIPVVNFSEDVGTTHKITTSDFVTTLVPWFGTTFATISSVDAKVPNTRTINGKALSSNISIDKSDVGLSNVDNTSDTNKPISTATQTALDGKASLVHTHAASDIVSGTKTSGFISDFQSAARNSISVTGNASYNSSTGVITVNNPSTRSYNNAPSRSIVTTAGAANGFQLSTTRDANVNYSVTINTSISLSGNATGYVVLEICPTNSANAGDWVEIGRTPSGQTGTLVVGLVLNQVGGGQVGGIVPSGYYARLRSVNTNGTPTYTYNSGQEVLL